MSIRRMLPFVLLNIIVSATVVLAVLFWWEGRRNDQQEAVNQALQAAATAPAATSTAEALIIVVTDTPEAPAEEEETIPEGMEIYIVRAGDTLATIATLYGVTLEDIVTVNNMDNPNVLQVDQQLLIPVGGIPTATPTIVPTETPNIPPTPIPTEPLTQGEAVIEIKEVISPGVLTEEAVSIVNSGSRPLALEGWKIVDAQGREFVFGQITLFGDGAGILVYTETGQSTPLELYWGLEEPLWEIGETVTLMDREGTTQATYTVVESAP